MTNCSFKQAGTLSGNPLAMTAGIKTLEIMGRPGAYEHLNAMSKRVVEGILEAGKAAGHDVCGGYIGGTCLTIWPSLCPAVIEFELLWMSYSLILRTFLFLIFDSNLNLYVLVGMFGFFFGKGPITCFEEAAENCDTEKFARWHRGMLERGVYLAPSQYEAGFTSLAHTEEDIDKTIAAAQEVMKTL